MTSPASPTATASALLPGSTNELAAIIRDAHASQSPLRFSGNATWLHGNGPFAPAQQVQLHNISGVVEYNPGDLVVSVHAGTTVRELNEITKEHGQMFALTPYGSPHSTLGAIVASASGAPLAFDSLTVRDVVLGLEVVTGTGAITKCGGRVVKNVAGFDLVRLHTGAWGTLGAITQIHLRLHAIPQVDHIVQADIEQPLADLLPELARISSLVPLLLIMQPNHAPVLMARISGNNSRAHALQKRLEATGVSKLVQQSTEFLTTLTEQYGAGKNDIRNDIKNDIIARMRAPLSIASTMLNSARHTFPNATLLYSLPSGSLRIVDPANSKEAREYTLSRLQQSSLAVVIDQGRLTPRTLNHLEKGIKDAFDPRNICNRYQTLSTGSEQ